jgi:cell division protease FtsH
VESAHQRAKDILMEHREALVTISEILLRRETIERAEFLALLAEHDAGRTGRTLTM